MGTGLPRPGLLQGKGGRRTDRAVTRRPCPDLQVDFHGHAMRLPTRTVPRPPGTPSVAGENGNIVCNLTARTALGPIFLIGSPDAGPQTCLASTPWAPRCLGAEGLPLALLLLIN